MEVPKQICSCLKTISGFVQLQKLQTRKKEVSIIDNRKIPCYASTSIEMRADGNEVLEVRTLETKVISSEQKEKVDYSKYEATIRRLGGKS